MGPGRVRETEMITPPPPPPEFVTVTVAKPLPRPLEQLTYGEGGGLLQNLCPGPRAAHLWGGRGRNYLIYTGPEGKPVGESRFPLSLKIKTDGVLNTKLSIKKKEQSLTTSLFFCDRQLTANIFFLIFF